MKNKSIKRIDKDLVFREKLLKLSRFKEGTIVKKGKHKIGCLDSTKNLKTIFKNKKAKLAIHDPPYNFIAFKEYELNDFITFCKKWVKNTYKYLKKDSSMYVWLGADQKNNFSPLPEFILMMKYFKFKSKSFITMRNQRGYGTQKNWMSVRQECLYYVKGSPDFKVQYTDIPKILKGYYKKIGDGIVSNEERSKSKTIRASNVWVDIQQVFYRMEENVNGCFAQKPIKAISRIIEASSNENDLVIDFFGHSGTTLIASEMLNRKCFILDNDPIFCEIMLRRLEYFLETGKTGWQNSNPFEKEIE